MRGASPSSWRWFRSRGDGSPFLLLLSWDDLRRVLFRVSSLPFQQRRRLSRHLRDVVLLRRRGLLLLPSLRRPDPGLERVDDGGRSSVQVAFAVSTGGKRVREPVGGRNRLTRYSTYWTSRKWCTVRVARVRSEGRRRRRRSRSSNGHSHPRSS